MKKFYEDPSLGIQTEDAPTNNAGSGAVSMPPDAKMGKKKKTYMMDAEKKSHSSREWKCFVQKENLNFLKKVQENTL